MQVEMILNVVVKGANFHELQHGLAEAALNSARTSEPITGSPVASAPPVPAVVVPPQGEHVGKVDPEREQIALEKEKKKWERKLKPTKAQTEAAQAAQYPESAQAPAAPAETVTTATPAPGAPTRKDAIAALSEVNANINYEAAKGALDKFGVKRLSELPDDKIAEFITHCQEVIAAGKTELPAGEA